MKDNELEDYRPQPLVPYRLANRVLQVPAKALELTLQVFRGSGRLETCCFWYGKPSRETKPSKETPSGATEASLVSAVVIPRQQQTWGNYSVTADAMLVIHRRIGSLGYRNLSQVHSHPGMWVEHSSYDDEMANSRDALSIVIPHYGRWASRWPLGIGVHEFQDDYWHLLSEQDAMRRVILVDGAEAELVDCR